MNPPFNLPVEFTTGYKGESNLLVAADIELICETWSSTPEERAYIALAVNNHEKLKTALINLLKVTELNYDDEHEEGTKPVVAHAYALLAELGEGGHQ
jgi:hypothetical protein